MNTRFLSLFSGIEAASCAWLPLGWECVGVAEIASFPCAVLQHHYPKILNLGDITTITQEQIEALGQIDVVVGGFPCQDVSIAGKRKGLKNEDGSVTRSGLFFDAMRIVRYAHPRWLLLENVPGIYSSNGGRDFASMVGEILGIELDLPCNGWKNTGIAASEKGLLEWATLDAQWFGVAQRRRRMFALADFGDWSNRQPILFERHSLQGHPAPRRQTGEEVAGTFTSRSSSGGWSNSVDLAAAGYMLPTKEIAKCLTCRSAGGANLDAETANFIVNKPIAFDCKSSGQHGFGIGEIAGTLRAMGSATSHQNGGGHLAIAFGIPGNWIGRAPENGGNAAEPMHNVSPCLTKTDHHAVAAFKGGQGSAAGGIGYDEHVSPTLSAADSGSNRTPTLMQDMQVRRLTPVECERLQGFPDHYTFIHVRGKPAADGLRYKALGNSMAVPVMHWIGSRIQIINNLSHLHDIANTA